MIDTDEYIEMWNNNLLGSEGVNDLMNALIAEVKRLKHELTDAIDNMNWLDGLAEKAEAEVERLREVLRDVKSDIDSYLNGGWNGVEGWEAISSIIGALGIQTDMDLMMEESE